MEKQSFIRIWLRDFWEISTHELRNIFSDSGVMLIFFVACLAYPLLYNIIYVNGILEKTPIAVVDMADCPESREFIREVDATRECSIAARCTSLAEAEKMMQERSVKGILYFPTDYGDRLASLQQAKIDIFCDMSSFMYYKNAMMGVNHVMLAELERTEKTRYNALGYSNEQAAELVQAIPYEENNPYNPAFSYSIFLVSAILLIIIQQTLFYGMSLLVGTMREHNRSFASLPGHLTGLGVGRVVFGRGSAFWLLYVGIAAYIAFIVPAIFGLPQRGDFWEVFLMLLFYVTDCVFFSMFWSSFITRRESVFILFLFLSPFCLFLTGTSWPTAGIPHFWKLFSYIFPSTFGVQGYLNLSVAGGTLETVRSQMDTMVLQTSIYIFLAFAAVYVENWIIRHREVLLEVRDKVDATVGIDRTLDRQIIAGRTEETPATPLD